MLSMSNGARRSHKMSVLHAFDEILGAVAYQLYASTKASMVLCVLA